MADDCACELNPRTDEYEKLCVWHALLTDIVDGQCWLNGKLCTPGGLIVDDAGVPLTMPVRSPVAVARPGEFASLTNLSHERGKRR